MFDTAIVIPWRATKSRMAPLAETVNHLAQILPQMPMIFGHVPGEVSFNYSAAKNCGIAHAEILGFRRVVVCDADTLVDSQPLYAAIKGCDDGKLHIPFDRYVLDKPDGTRQVFTNATGGCHVMTTEAFHRAGGADTAFEGWGFDDVAFRVQCETLLGATVIHPGTARHVWHDRPETSDPNSESYQRNLARWRRYEAANGDPQKVKALKYQA